MSRARDFADLAGAADAGGLTGRNLIINGAMQVAQRGTSKSNPSGGYDTVDRFRVEGRTGQGGASTATQESFTPAASYPALLKNYFQLAITATPSSNPMHIEQRIEDCVTLNGQKVTLSFWGKVTSGTYDVTTNYENNSGGSGGTVQGSSAHTLTTTWTRFTETVTLPTVSSGTTGPSTYLKVQILFPIASGTNTVQITGVKLEVGDTATDFDHSESYGETLARCQRYYETIHSLIPGAASGTTTGHLFAEYKVRKRAAATLERFGDATRNVARANNQNEQVTNTPSLAMNGVDGCRMSFTTAGNLTAGIATYLKDLQTTPIAFSAEL